MVSDGQRTDADFMRRWLEAEAARLGNTVADDAWDRAETLFRSWTDLLGPAGPSADGANPLDPSDWLQPAGQAGMLLLANALTGAAGLPNDPGPDREVWRKWSAALERHRRLIGQAWLEAFRAFVERSRRVAAKARRDGAEPPDGRALEALWRECADERLARTMASKDYLATQRALLEAGLELRRAFGQRLEALAELAGLPSRTEIDDLTAELDRLRREVRTLRKKCAG